MGLGKTLSSIAVIAGHPSEDRKVKTTLVVAPLALLEQYVDPSSCSILTIRWKAEIESKTTSGRKVLIHWGPKRTNSPTQLKQYDVVLTTYGILTAEHGKQACSFDQTMGLMLTE
jgi:SNF2 family DNA or RNA helicase